MRRVFGTMALTTFAVLGPALPALAQQHCDTYSGACVEGNKQVKPPSRPAPQVGGLELPFTGAAIAGLVLVGSVAIVGGTVLVSAGRRRRTAS